MEINGRTRLTGVIGFPLEHTLSPAIFNFVFQELGLNWSYVPLTVKPADLSIALDGLRATGFVGVNVTMPHKERVFSLLDGCDEYAGKVGAVNTVHFHRDKILGYNTDGQGFLQALADELSFHPEGKKVVIIGAGGVARAVAVSLALAGIKKMVIINRTLERGRSLAENVKQIVPGREVVSGSLSDDLASYFDDADLVVNATSVGMEGTSDQTPVDLSLIGKKHCVFDLIYDPAQTLFLKGARERGAKTANGLKMLVYQAAAAFKIWTDREMPVDVGLKAVKERLKAGEGRKILAQTLR